MDVVADTICHAKVARIAAADRFRATAWCAAREPLVRRSDKVVADSVTSEIGHITRWTLRKVNYDRRDTADMASFCKSKEKEHSAL